MLDKVKKWFKQFTDPIIERITAPFGVTYIIVWCVHNWKVVFSVFNFDVDQSREEKIEIILSYNDSGEWLGLSNDFFWIPIAWTFGVLILYYTASSISLFIVTIYERYIKPIIFNLLDKNENITKDKFRSLKVSYSKLKEDSDKIEQESLMLSNQIETLESEIQRKEDKAFQDQLKLTRLKMIISIFPNWNHSDWSESKKKEYDTFNYDSVTLFEFLNHVANDNNYDSEIFNKSMVDHFEQMKLIDKVQLQYINGRTSFEMTEKGKEFISLKLHKPEFKFQKK